MRGDEAVLAPRKASLRDVSPLADGDSTALDWEGPVRPFWGDGRDKREMPGRDGGTCGHSDGYLTRRVRLVESSRWER